MKQYLYLNMVKNTLVVYLFLIAFRCYETLTILHQHIFDTNIIKWELHGLLIDCLGASVFIMFYTVLVFYIGKINAKLIGVFNALSLGLATVVFFLIIQYFLYQLIPLDIFLYKYSLQEIFLTLGASQFNFTRMVLSLIVLLIVVFLAIKAIGNVKFSPKYTTLVWVVVLASLPIFAAIKFAYAANHNKFLLNKPLYFINKSLVYLVSKSENISPLTNEFKTLYPEKEFINNEYPLVYKRNNHDQLGKYFNTFTTAPNVVVLIVEGLNNDFIHNYQGALLMPFLQQLKNKSLYWSRSFTLGERSFAAVPSILGGLPYGDRGFLLQDKLPRHLSLVSQLSANGYYTSFFYGQGAWFHQKDRFFRYNNIDLIIDNSKYSNNYSKIIVGEGNNKFFWGYNDKDLFSQSLKVVDSTRQNPRLDIYFTGTSHSPFIISNNNYYTKKLNEITPKTNIAFYQKHAQYLKSVLFVDDALKSFFEAYEKRNDYKNTIFIITGDHPMSELPVANSLKRYHVPLIIYANNLKEGNTFTNTVSHLDVSESMLSLLQKHLKHLPTISTSLGGDLIANKPTKNIIFMNDNREVVDILSGNHYLNNDELYLVDSLLNIKRIEDIGIKTQLKRKLSVFRNTGIYAVRADKVISNEDYCNALQLQKLHSNSISQTQNVTSEYHTLVNNMKLTNNNITYDVSFKLTHPKKENMSIVYQITDVNDSTLIWNNIGVGNDGMVQIRIPINKVSTIDGHMMFKSYIWNKDKIPFTISDLNVLLYSSQNKTNLTPPSYN